MNIEEFNKKFGTEKQCREYLFKLRWGSGYECPKCHGNKYYKIGDYKYKCANNKCYYQATLTTGTLMEKTHLPIQKWFYAVFIISRDPHTTSDWLSKKLDISYKTAYYMLNKIDEIVYRTEYIKNDIPLTGTGVVVGPTIDLSDGASIHLMLAIEYEGDNIKRMLLHKLMDPYHFIADYVDEKARFTPKATFESTHYRRIEREFKSDLSWHTSDEDWDKIIERFNFEHSFIKRRRHNGYSIDEVFQELIHTPPEPRRKE